MVYGYSICTLNVFDVSMVNQWWLVMLVIDGELIVNHRESMMVNSGTWWHYNG